MVFHFGTFVFPEWQEKALNDLSTKTRRPRDSKEFVVQHQVTDWAQRVLTVLWLENHNLALAKAEGERVMPINN